MHFVFNTYTNIDIPEIMCVTFIGLIFSCS